MEESYAELVRKSDNYKTEKNTKFKEISKDRLLKISKKKVQTTMIGALSSIEEHFSFLWESDGDLSEQQQAMYDTYQQVRSEILDKGNTQDRNVDAELNQYEVTWLKYQVNIPVKSN